MISEILSVLANFAINTISTLGYPGVFICMAIESALIPLPSEVIMPFAGYLITTGRFTLWGVVLVGALGNVTGSLIAYAFGYWGREKVVRRFVRKWGRFLLISEHEYDQATDWVKKKGGIVSFTSRLLPAIRTIISLPVGVARYNVSRFIIYTFIGSFIWSFLLAELGIILGENWDSLKGYFHKFDLLIVGVVVAAGIFLIYKKLK